MDNYRLAAPASSERIQWIDSMRGFSMFLVVLGHVMLYMGIGNHSTFLSTLMMTFRMPLFFFVSGFFSYKSLDRWNRKNIGRIMKRKCQAQILGTMVFVLVYDLVFDQEWLEQRFGGYWFTIVLFQMFCIYMALTVISKKIGRDIVIPSIIAISAIFLALLFWKGPNSGLPYHLDWYQVFVFMQFFATGIVCARYRDRMFALLASSRFATIVIIGYLAMMLVYYSDWVDGIPFFFQNMLREELPRYFGLATVVLVFYRNRRLLESEERIFRTLRFIGRRTLDLYFIHYFLLPHMEFLRPWLAPDNMLVVQLALSSAVSVVVVAIALFLSSLLRQSDFLAANLFGARPTVRAAVPTDPA